MGKRASNLSSPTLYLVVQPKEEGESRKMGKGCVCCVVNVCVCGRGGKGWRLNLIYLGRYYYFWQTRDGNCINRLNLCGFSRDATLPLRWVGFAFLFLFWGKNTYEMAGMTALVAVH